MFDILFARTFFIVGVMLIITAIGTYLNKSKDRGAGLLSIVILFGLLLAVMFTANMFPLNLVMVGLFSGYTGWMISPAIKSMGDRWKTGRFLKKRGIVLKKGEVLTKEQEIDLIEYLNENQSDEQWSRIVSQAIFSTAIAVFATASLVFISDFDFSFLGIFLFIALLILIVMGLLNIFIFKSRLFSLIKAYFGVVIFTLYLIYDFNTLEKMAGDESWGTAINIAVNIYLDIINLFLYILEILSSDN